MDWYWVLKTKLEAPSMVWLLVVPTVTVLAPALVRLMVYCLPVMPMAMGKVI